MRHARFFAVAVQCRRRRIGLSVHFAPSGLSGVSMPTLISTFLINSPDSDHYSMTDGIVRADKNIPLDDALKLAEQHPIWANRGKAIQSYAILEQALSGALAELGGMTRTTAVTIFYKITNTGSRSGILEKLLQKNMEHASISFGTPTSRN
jgi:hypothetical protein